MPDDPFINEMDPVQKIWMFYNWFADQKDIVEVAKNQAYLIGSFHNPEAVKKLLDQENNSHISSDEEFDETSRMVLEGNVPLPDELKLKNNFNKFDNKQENKINKRKRRSIKG